MELPTPSRPDSSLPGPPVVNSHNEWDPLEEVVVGVIDGACIPTWDIALEATMPEASRSLFRNRPGQPFPAELIDVARRDLEGFARILESEGITVRRPATVDHTRPYATPWWASRGGLYAAMPRDTLLCIGDEIIEVPMAWRSRYFETHAFRPLLKEYFRRGARWTAAPKPELTGEQFDDEFVAPGPDEPLRFVITEFEPTFDAADFTRCGRDIFCQRSNVTNEFGIEWLRRHLGPDYRIHVLEFDDPHPMHIDATLVPLAPGKVLVNPDRVRSLPRIFADWDVLPAPLPAANGTHEFLMCSSWISMNVLMLDPVRVCVERHQEPLIRALADWGFEPIPIEMSHFNHFGGGFHCCTLDVRRAGGLESYFPNRGGGR